MLNEKRVIDWSKGFLDGSFVQRNVEEAKSGKPGLEKGRK
jgi:hypothetical protein